MGLGDMAKALWDNGGKDMAMKLVSNALQSNKDEKNGIAATKGDKKEESLDLGAFLGMAVKMWNNGGQEAISKLVESSGDKNDKQALAATTKDGADQDNDSKFDALFEIAKKAWENGGKEMAGSLIAKAMSSSNKEESTSKNDGDSVG